MFQKVIDESKSLKSQDIDVIRTRAAVALDPASAVHSIPDSSSVSLLALKQYAIFKSNPKQKDHALAQVQEWLQSEMLKSDPVLQLVAAQMHFDAGDFRSALKMLEGENKNLDKMALRVNILLKLSRPDLAIKVVRQMQDENDDDVLTQLAQVAVQLHPV